MLDQGVDPPTEVRGGGGRRCKRGATLEDPKTGRIEENQMIYKKDITGVYAAFITCDLTLMCRPDAVLLVIALAH